MYIQKLLSRGDLVGKLEGIPEDDRESAPLLYVGEMWVMLRKGAFLVLT